MSPKAHFLKKLTKFFKILIFILKKNSKLTFFICQEDFILHY